jgi:hypothetical protein
MAYHGRNPRRAFDASSAPAEQPGRQHDLWLEGSLSADLVASFSRSLVVLLRGDLAIRQTPVEDLAG